MQFVIPCETFVRLSIAAIQPDEADHPKANCRCVRLENRNGKTIAVATSGLIMVAELIGDTEEQDGSVHVIVDPALIEACRAEIAFSGNLTVTYADGWAAAQTTFGYMYPMNAAVEQNWPVEWRTLAPEAPKKSSGAFVFSAEALARMAKCSPSGFIVLPRHVDKTQPSVVRCRSDDSWIGMFLVKDGKDQTTEPATVPAWVQA